MSEKVFTNKSENNNFNPYAKKLIGIAAASAVFFLPVACKSAEGGASVPYNASCLDKLNDDSSHKLIDMVHIDHVELTGGTDKQYADALSVNIMHEINYPGGAIDQTSTQQDNEVRQSLDSAISEKGQHGNDIEIIAYPRDGKSDIHDGYTEIERDPSGLRQYQVDPDTAYCVNIKD